LFDNPFSNKAARPLIIPMKPKDRIEHNLNEIRSTGVIFAERSDENCCYLAPTEKTPQKGVSSTSY